MVSPPTEPTVFSFAKHGTFAGKGYIGKNVMKGYSGRLDVVVSSCVA